MNETTENLFKALQQYKPPETKPVIWKLYYNIKTGKPIDLTTEDLVVDNNDVDFVVVSREVADTYPHLNPQTKIVDKKITYVPRQIKVQDKAYTLRVYKDPKGNIITDEYNMLIINNSTGTNRWSHE